MSFSWLNAFWPQNAAANTSRSRDAKNKKHRNRNRNPTEPDPEHPIPDPRCALTDPEPVPPALRIAKLHAHAHTQINNTSGFNSRGRAAIKEKKKNTAKEIARDVLYKGFALNHPPKCPFRFAAHLGNPTKRKLIETKAIIDSCIKLIKVIIK